MVGPQLGRETDAIAESAYVRDYTARDIIIRSAGKVVRPKPDQPDQRRCLWLKVQKIASTCSWSSCVVIMCGLLTSVSMRRAATSL